VHDSRGRRVDRHGRGAHAGGADVIDLYTAATPAAFSVSITLEETGLPYQIHPIDLGALEHKGPEFLKINPNGRIPAIRDRETGVTVFESGAIRLYLAEKSGKLLPRDPVRRWQAMSWLFLQVTGVGPHQGQANAFIHYFPEKLPSVMARYKNETRRLYGVADRNLADKDYLAHEFSIADCGLWPWVRIADYAEVDVAEFPNLSAWFDRVAARPAVQRGLVPEPGPATPEESFAVGQRILML
jgi:GST-like protein